MVADRETESKGVAWARRVMAEKLATQRLPRIGRGYTARYRAAYAVAEIADRKLYTRRGFVCAENPLRRHERVFWTDVLRCANEVKVDESNRPMMEGV